MKGVLEFERVHLYRDPVDMRKAINGLSELVQSSGEFDLMKPHLFVFMGRRRNSIKVLYFDRSGFCLWQKRLEKEKFQWPKKHTESVVNISPEQFSWLLEGYDVWKMKPFEKLHYDRVS